MDTSSPAHSGQATFRTVKHSDHVHTDTLDDDVGELFPHQGPLVRINARRFRHVAIIDRAIGESGNVRQNGCELRGFAFGYRAAAWSYLSVIIIPNTCLLYTSPSPRDGLLSRMPSSA